MKSALVTFDPQAFALTVAFNSKNHLIIRRNDLCISFFSGGPGGQNVNRNMNGVRLIYFIPDSHRRQASKTRQLVVRSMAQRSQHQNLLIAFRQLAHKLEQYFYVPPVRKKSKTPQRAKEKRLKSKKHQSFKKQTRQKVEL